jgi:hypothetical protein
MLWRVRERSRPSSPSQLLVAGPLSPYNVIIYLFCIELLLCSKDVTFDPVLFIICVRLGPSTPGDYVRARVLVPLKSGCDTTFRKRWPGDWMKEWLYVKNDLKVRENIKDIIVRPIWQRFGLRKPKVEIDEAAEACRRAFDTVCSFIGTRDLVQEHIAFRIWPLLEKWEMLKETDTKTGEGDMVRLKYSFKYGDKFDEPNDDWLKCIEATSDELLGPYSKAEDNALSTAFGSQKKKRLNRVFDAIGFMYPDYRYPPKGQKRKSATSGKDVTSAALSEPAPKRRKVKVLTYRPRYIEPATVPEFGGETSSATKAEEPALTQRIEEPATMLKVNKIEEPRIEETKISVLSPSGKVTVPKAQKDLITTPKRKELSMY